MISRVRINLKVRALRTGLWLATLIRGGRDHASAPDPDRLPNFLIVGANKGGTTSLYYYLKQHPEICMSAIKEPRFFAIQARRAGPGADNVAGQRSARNAPLAENQIRDPGAVDTLPLYQRLFAGCAGKKARGEASTNYLSNADRVIPLIKDLVPGIRIIGTLRSPVQRAYSYHLMRCAHGAERRSFDEVMAEFERGVSNEYATLSLYARPVARYQQAFGRDRCLFLPYDALGPRGPEFLRSIFEFLQVDPDFQPNFRRRHNKGKHWARKLSNDRSTRLSRATEEKYMPLFEQDLRSLAPLVDFDPRAWLRFESAAESWRPDRSS